VFRKRLFGVSPEHRLAPDAYETSVTDQVYSAIASEAETLLTGGHAVILDAVFARPDERAAAREIARAVGVPFAGFWLEAPLTVLERRIAGRRDDASDADIEIVRRQAAYETGEMDWRRVDTVVAQDRIVAELQAALAQSPS
jgi:predicted kinase